MAKNIRIDDNTSFNLESGEFITSNTPSALPTPPSPPTINPPYTSGRSFSGWWIFISIVTILLIYFIYQSSNVNSPNPLPRSSSSQSSVVNRTGYISAKTFANIRSGPTANYGIIVRKYKGESVYVLEKDLTTGWYKVIYSDNSNDSGYVSNSLISFNNQKYIRSKQKSESENVVAESNLSELSNTEPTESAKQFKMILCSDCNGNGQIQSNGTCSDCNGSGQVNCTECDGQGKSVCFSCKGARYFRCTSCNGVGTLPGNDGYGYGNNNGRHNCLTCSGSGRTLCLTCMKTGYLLCRTCGKTGKLRCNTCYGKGQVSGNITCQQCKGVGKIQVEI